MSLDYWTLHEAPPDSPKKWAVRVPTASGKGKTVLFGARGYEDFTTHGDVERRERYRTRHQHDRIDDPYAPGFWSMWALWGESANLDTSFANAVRKAKNLTEKTMARKNPAKMTKKLSKIVDYLYENGPTRLYNFDAKDIKDLLSMRDTIVVFDVSHGDFPRQGRFVDLTPGEISAMDNRVKNLHLNLQKFQVESDPRQNPVRESFNFSHYEEYANRLTDDQLHHAIIDALDTLKVARTWEDNGAGEAKYLDQLYVLRREQKSRGKRSNPGPMREDWLKAAKKQGRQDAMNFGDSLGERRDYLEQAGWRDLDPDDRQALLQAWDEGAFGSRQNPEWAKTVGKHLYTGTRYAAESARDLYRGAVDEHRTRKPRPS